MEVYAALTSLFRLAKRKQYCVLNSSDFLSFFLSGLFFLGLLVFEHRPVFHI